MLPLTSDHLVRGQFRGYRREQGVAPDSKVETFAAPGEYLVTLTLTPEGGGEERVVYLSATVRPQTLPVPPNTGDFGQAIIGGGLLTFQPQPPAAPGLPSAFH